ncbi:unnamed protein product [Colletotrichum noveboracense]|uniref:Kinesin light chain n=1 Tax=Colletotrichum noveboracense TaxID=2664923 RepID=A0A9W4S7E9_9PEZI|nr:unnamed protein product [Colletotrichum noveboracense]
MASHSRPRRREDFQVAVICALPLEYDAAVFACDELRNAPGDYNAYATGRMGGHDIVLLLLPNMGKVGAASAAASLRSSYHGIRLAILTGICGGVPGVGTTNEVFLGDVVISKSIVQYDLGRKYPSRFKAKDSIEESLGRPSKEVRSLVATFQTIRGLSALQRRASQILEQVQRRSTDEGHQTLYRRPAATEDRLFESDYLHRHRNSSQCGCNESNACESAQAASCDVLRCERSHLVSRSSSLETQASPEQAEFGTAGREFRVLVGRVGSADTVLKAGLERDRIAGEHDLVAFEMEGAGIWDEIPCIVIKAVCDYADSHKNKEWQHFAAATAASTTKALLEHYMHTSSADLKLCIRSNGFSGTSRTSATSTRLQNRARESRFMVLEVLGNATASSEPLCFLISSRKTQIALAYVFWMQHAHPDVFVFWVHASNADRFRQAYSTIAQECGIPGYDDPKVDMLKLVKTWLENGTRGQWLMVIDNADDTQLFFPSLSNDSITNTHLSANTQDGLGRYIPECGHGCILVTTRNKQTASKLTWGKPIIKVGDMSENESSQMLHKILHDDVSAKELSILSARLEYLPLALAQAAAFIQENSVSIDRYLKLLEESNDSLVDQLSEPFEAIGRDSGTPHALTATWIVSFNQIQQQDPLASDLLSFACLLDRQGIPENLIVGFCEQRKKRGQQISTSKMLKALGTLKAFSLVSEAKDNVIDMHRLVQLVTRKWLEMQDGLAGCIGDALEVVSDLYPYGRYESRQLCQDYLPHANAVLQHNGSSSHNERLTRAFLLLNVTGYFLYCGRWAQAEQVAAQSIKLREEILGEEHPDTLRSMGNLAATYRNQGRWEEAEELNMRVMETSLRVLGEEHPYTLTSIANLALTYMNQGRWKEAEELNVRVMEMNKRVLGEEHPETLRSMHNLALTWKDLEQWEDAMQLLQDCVRRRENVLGVNHPETMSSASALSDWELDFRETSREGSMMPSDIRCFYIAIVRLMNTAQP